MIKTFTRITSLLAFGLMLGSSFQGLSQTNATITVVDQLCSVPGSITVDMNDKAVGVTEDLGAGQYIDSTNTFVLSSPLNNVTTFVLGITDTSLSQGVGAIITFYDSNGNQIYGNTYYYDPGAYTDTIQIGGTLNDVASIQISNDWYSYFLDSFYFITSNYSYSWTPFFSLTNQMHNAYMGTYTCTATNVETNDVYFYSIWVGQQGQDVDGDGYDCFDDCDDNNPNAFPGNSPDLCDLADNDCDGAIDEDGTAVDPNEYPMNTWKLYAYNGNYFNDYRGQYTIGDVLDVATQNAFNESGTPSDAPNYEGCYVNYDNHSYRIRREGFPTNDYIITLHSYDDDLTITIDGNVVYYNTCCGWGDQIFGPFSLTDTTRVEFALTEYGGGSNVNFSISPAIYGCMNYDACNYDPTANVDQNCSFYPTVTGWNNSFTELNWTVQSTSGLSYQFHNDSLQIVGSGLPNYYSPDTLIISTTTNQTLYFSYNTFFTYFNPSQTDSLNTNYGFYYNGSFYFDGWDSFTDYNGGNNWTVYPGDTFGFYLIYNTNLSAPYFPDWNIFNINIDRPCVHGCTNANACNYASYANFDDGSCVLPVAEICNAIDDDCNGFVDDGLVYNTYYVDADQDAWGTDFYGTTCEDLTPAFALNSGDCDDTNPNINPGVAEILDNNIDDDCNPNTPDVGITELSASSQILTFPNPAHNELNVVVSTRLIGSELVIYDAVGNAIQKQVLTNATTHVATSNLANGNYIARVAGQTVRFTVVH